MERSLLGYLKEGTQEQRDAAERLRGKELSLVGWGVLVHGALRCGEPMPTRNNGCSRSCAGGCVSPNRPCRSKKY